MHPCDGFPLLCFAGFGGAPKFPRTSEIDLLLRAYLWHKVRPSGRMRHVMQTHAKELVELLFFKPCVELGHALSWTPTPLHYVRRRACAPCCTQGKGEDPEAARALHMATFSLDKMAAGGMYDHIGGGFHRYRWVNIRAEGSSCGFLGPALLII